MTAPPREALAEYLEYRRQIKAGWDAFHRRACRHTFIHCRLALSHLMAAVVRLDGGLADDETLDTFLTILGEHIPLDKAVNFDLILNPPELKPLKSVSWENLTDSVSDWLITRKIERGRAFEYLTLTQETANLVITCMEKKFPSFFTQMNQ